MSAIEIKTLTFAYEGNPEYLFQNVGLRIDTDWKLGVIGRNGKGKTTLLRLLAGELEYRGTIVSPKIEFRYFPFPVSDPTQSVFEIVAQIDPAVEEWRVLKELALMRFGDVDLTRRYDTFSQGEQTKILLAALFCIDGAYLLIDEPTNHLDAYGRASLAAYLNKKSSYLVVSHDTCFLDGCIDHVLNLEKTNFTLTVGNASTSLAEQAARLAREQTENQRLKGEIRRLQEASARAKNWAQKAEKEKYGGKNKSGLHPDRGYLGAKSAKLMKRALVVNERAEKAIEEKSALLKNYEKQQTVSLTAASLKSETLISIRDFVAVYDGRQINRPLTFDLIPGQRVALVGKNGCGKSSLLKAVCGDYRGFLGAIAPFRRLKLSYVAQDLSAAIGTLDDFCARYALDKNKLLVMLSKLGLESTRFFARLQDFSDGQKKKLLIAKSLCENADLYLWDEPLNYVDPISRKQILSALIQSGATMLFVEHDRGFADAAATQTIFMERIAEP